MNAKTPRAGDHDRDERPDSRPTSPWTDALHTAWSRTSKTANKAPDKAGKPREERDSHDTAARKALTDCYNG
jgi:hypothetical protein